MHGPVASLVPGPWLWDLQAHLQLERSWKSEELISLERSGALLTSAVALAVLGCVRGGPRMQHVGLVYRQGWLRLQRQLQRPLPLQVSPSLTHNPVNLAERYLFVNPDPTQAILCGAVAASRVH